MRHTSALVARTAVPPRTDRVLTSPRQSGLGGRTYAPSLRPAGGPGALRQLLPSGRFDARALTVRVQFAIRAFDAGLSELGSQVVSSHRSEGHRRGQLLLVLLPF